MLRRLDTYGKPASRVNGWIRVQRALLEHDIVGAGSEGRYSRTEAWLWLIMHAAYEPTTVQHNGARVQLEPGELIVSRRELAGIWGWSQSAVRWFLERLGNSQAADIVTAHNTTRITLTNYEKYQDVQPTISPRNSQASAHLTAHIYKDNHKPLTKEDSSASADAALPKKPIAEAFAAYNELARKIGLPVAVTLTGVRFQKIKARLKEHGADGWQRALANLEASKFLRGDNDRGWRASLDFILQASSYGKLVDGAYQDGGAAGNKKGFSHVSTSIRDTDENFDAYRQRLIREGRYTPSTE